MKPKLIHALEVIIHNYIPEKLDEVTDEPISTPAYDKDYPVIIEAQVKYHNFDKLANFGNGFHPIGDGYLLTDLQSKNGSFVNNQNVTSHWLKHGDVVTIGKHTLVFGHEEEAAQAEAAPSTMDQTMVMDTEQYRSMVSKGGGNEATKVLDEAPPAVLSYLSGGEGEVELTKKLIKIGKDSTSDVVVSGLMVGQTAATISKRPNGYFLSYVGGMAKPKVNEAAVKESVKLNEFDTIEVKFRYDFIKVSDGNYTDFVNTAANVASNLLGGGNVF